MRKFKLFLIGIFICNYGLTQINFEHQFGENTSGVTFSQLSIVKLENNGLKYKLINTLTNQLILYNMDYSLYKTIDLTILNPFYTVVYVSESLFDTDNTNLEYLLWQYDLHKIQIFREDGILLFSKDSAALVSSITTNENDLYSLINVGNFYKLMLRNYFDTTYNIYSLPGTFPCNDNCGFPTFKKDETINTENLFNIKVFPNPTTDITTLEFNLPKDFKFGEAIIYNEIGNVKKRFKISKNDSHISFSSTDLQPGVYFYRIELPTKSSMAKKMFVIH